MADFNSKYSGEQVEELLDQVASGNTGGGGGGGTTDLSNVVQYNENGQAVIQNGTIYDGNSGILYALPSASAIDRGEADYVIATDVDLNEKQNTINDLAAIRSGASKGATSAQQELLQTGASAVVVPDGVLVDGGGSIYALPDVDETTKEASDYVLATEEYVDSKVGSGGGGKEFVEVEPIFEPGGSTGSFMPENPLQPNKVYVFTETISSLSINSIEASNSIVDEYTVMFTAASTNVVISINYKYQVYWANGVTPSVVEGDMCELSLVRIGNDIKAVLTPFKTV